MNILNEYTFIWEREKDKYVILEDQFGKSIFNIQNNALSILLIEDDNIKSLVLQKMIDNGNQVYHSIEELQLLVENNK